MSLESTEKLLVEWGKWARRGQIIPRYMSPATAMYLHNVEQDREPDPQITEDEAMMIDRAISRLRIRDAGVHEILFDHYLCRKSIRFIMRTRQMPERLVNEVINRGIGWIDAVLDTATQQV